MKRTRVPLKAGRVRVYSKDSSGIRYESGYLAKFMCVDRKAVVYFLVKNSEVIYIGRTISLQTRLYAHVRNRVDFDEVRYLQTDNYIKQEDFFIKAFQTRFNKKPGCKKVLREQDTRIRTHINTQLWRQLRAQAALESRNAGNVLDDAIRLYLAKRPGNQNGQSNENIYSYH